MVGSHFVESRGADYELHAVGRTNRFGKGELLRTFKKIDITDHHSLVQAIGRSGCDLLVNFAAFTGVDLCEAESGDREGLAFKSNALAVRWMAESCRASGMEMYHISTDAVFDGTKGPYSEDAVPGPAAGRLSWYGYTKWIAELGLRKALEEHCIVRISHPYRANFAPKLDFARKILTLYSKGKLYPLFTDQVFTPTLIDDLSNALAFLFDRRARGTFHVASPLATTPFDFGEELVRVFFQGGVTGRHLDRGSVTDFNLAPGHAPRLVKGGLNTSRLERAGFTPRNYREGIEEIFRQSRREGSENQDRRSI
jgi:dTDP-4-dehydrorhamnose reductase